MKLEPFDELTESLAGDVSRRQMMGGFARGLLGAIAAGLTMPLGGRPVEAKTEKDKDKKGRPTGANCKEDYQCGGCDSCVNGVCTRDAAKQASFCGPCGVCVYFKDDSHSLFCAAPPAGVCGPCNECLPDRSTEPDTGDPGTYRCHPKKCPPCQECLNDACIPCSGPCRKCKDDGTCGGCDPDEECINGSCIHPFCPAHCLRFNRTTGECELRDDECGPCGICIEEDNGYRCDTRCLKYEECVNGECVEKKCPPCHRLNRDTGNCDNVCPPDAECCAGLCRAPCDASQCLTCNEDAASGLPLGTCVSRCGPNQMCCNGSCTGPCDASQCKSLNPETCQCEGCPPNQECVRGGCVSRCGPCEERDAAGICQSTCEAGQACCDGQCVGPCDSTQCQRLNPETCQCEGCPPGQECINGRCLPPCAACEERDATGTCRSTCGPCKTCDPSTGACAAVDCGSPCLYCDPGAGGCLPIPCATCQVCDEEKGCVDVDCGPCATCQNNTCVSTCGPCQVCNAQGTCESTCSGPCQVCDTSVIPAVCRICKTGEKCCNGYCQPSNTACCPAGTKFCQFDGFWGCISPTVTCCGPTMVSCRDYYAPGGTSCCPKTGYRFGECGYDSQNRLVCR
jgi:hypothetical protein